MRHTITLARHQGTHGAQINEEGKKGNRNNDKHCVGMYTMNYKLVYTTSYTILIIPTS